MAPFASRFRRATSRASGTRSLTGLLTDLPHKNCDTIAAAVVGTSTARLQHLLTDATWELQALDAQRVRALAAPSPPPGLLVLDATGLPKHGRGSVGVARQYSGTLGNVANGQVVVIFKKPHKTPPAGPGPAPQAAPGPAVYGQGCPRGPAGDPLADDHVA